MKIIYLYTTPTYQTKNWYKIGETTTDPEKRIQAQDNASNPEQLKFIASWQTADWVTDKLVHKKLVELGFAKLRGNREWFELSEIPEDDIEAALIEIKADPQEREKACVMVNIPVLDYPEIWWGKGTNP